MELDHSTLAFSFHSAMLTGFVFIQDLIQEYGMYAFYVIIIVICDRLCKNQPSSDLVVIRETPV